MKLFKVLPTILGLSIGAPTAALAVPVTVDGQAYNISIIPGDTPNIDDILKSQIWFEDSWHDGSIAFEFAQALKFDAFRGGISPYYYGPLFVFDIYGVDYGGSLGPGNEYIFYYYQSSDPAGLGGLATASLTFRSEGWNFAIATPSTTTIPIPAGGLLLLSGIAGATSISRRKRKSAD